MRIIPFSVSAWLRNDETTLHIVLKKEPDSLSVIQKFKIVYKIQQLAFFPLKWIKDKTNALAKWGLMHTLFLPRQNLIMDP